MDMSKIDRIDELYYKSQVVGLTGEEKEEQVRLHQEYATVIRESLCNNLNNISIKKSGGSITDPGKRHGGVGEV